MKKILLVGCLVLAGCAGTLPTLNLNTTVSRNTMLSIESGYGIALSGEKTYKALCKNKSIPDTCKVIVARLQLADQKAIAAIRAAVAFIKTYPNVDATNALGAATMAIGDLQEILNSTGVN